MKIVALVVMFLALVTVGLCIGWWAIGMLWPKLTFEQHCAALTLLVLLSASR